MLIAADRNVLTILLVQNNPADARLVLALLRDCSAVVADVRHVSTIAGASDALADEVFDAVLLDLSLPDAAGMATLRHVRAIAPHLPIIILSADEDEAAATAAISAGAQDVLHTSQLDDAALLRALRHAMSRHELMFRGAYVDPLTGLPDRTAFRDGVSQALARAQRYAERMAVLFVDVDGFARINDAYGHEAGDAVLRITAHRMRETLRASDEVARYGGDTFTIMLPFIESDEDAVLVAARVRRCISAPLAIDGNDVELSASIGIALFPEDGRDADTLTLRAGDTMDRDRRYRAAAKRLAGRASS